ncbi:DUF982 domain-containing protein [Aquibium sp. LZ166]|uniref:DUF982 domain-containing protein n=1 Tax=Aquibium pacificus TaxID=3153579 RepID=A0ABV3SGQ2_9HYPH
MQKNHFEVPVTVKAGNEGDSKVLSSPREASDFLLNNWQGKRSAKHRAALQACHDAVSSGKPAMTARRAFVAAAREADLLLSDKVPG